MQISKIKSLSSIAILWFWKEGKSTLSFLLKLWIDKSIITILDANPIDIQDDILTKSGDEYLNNLWDYEIIFKSPGISPYEEKIIPYRDKLTSQSQVFFDNYQWRVIWVTATKGKSTVSTLIYETLKHATYNVKLVWNIGSPVLDEIDLLSDNNYNYVIYELSSYMLETLEPTCDIGVFLNLYTCHLDWHNHDFEVYKKAKMNLIQYSDYIVLSEEFSDLNNSHKEIKYFWANSRFSYDSDGFYKDDNKLFWLNELILPWNHNKKNISSVIAVIDTIVEKYNHNSPWIFSKLINSLSETLKTFWWLPHRLEKIWTYKWITFIDDGISTTPESTIEAIKTYWDDIECIFLWGSDYWFTEDSYELLRREIYKYNIKKIVFFPTTWPDVFSLKIEGKLNLNGFSFSYNDSDFQAIYTDNMEKAVKFAYDSIDKWICLMSCAAPSYSVWPWYEEKWKLFKEFIIKNKD